MATFPALKPATRTYTPGRYPHSEIATLSGLQTRVRVSNVLIDRRLQLTFVSLTEAEMLSIRSHYLGQQGRFLSFTIPDDLLSGVITPANFTPTGYGWIYASRPTVTDTGLQRYDVTVELATVPPEGANVNGLGATVGIGFTPGVTTVTGPGANYIITAAIVGGIVADNASAGFNLTVACSFVAGIASAPAVDPDFSSVSLLLHLDGADGSTTFTDNSSNAFTMTRGGNAELDTAVKKFGTAAVIWDGSGDFLRTPSDADFTFGTGDFTIEFWSYFNSSFNTTAAAILMSIGAFRNIMYISNTLRFRTDGGTNLITGGALSLGTWYHIALTKSGNDHKLFIDGTQTGSTYTNTSSYTADRITFGANNSGSNNYLGSMDEIRVTTGVARYTANFTAPAQPFADS